MPDYIARFEVLEKIGEGGMGAVFKARDPHISRIVAIKLLREGFDSKDMRERFMQEARSAGGLQNPNIVTIFELGEHGGAPFIVMEFVVGDTLDRLIKRRASMALVRKLGLMEVLCSGLGYAHQAGVIHRDIKPANLIVSTDGVLKILDFGIARVGNSELTRTGALMGTPNYMPPEQLNGQRIDKRADIFAVGAVFYELLAYQRAFPGNYAEAITRILSREPDPLSQVCEGLDPQIEAVVLKALQKNPDRRYQDLSDMRRELVKIRMRLERDLPSADTVVFMPSADGAAEQLLEQATIRRAVTEVETAQQLFEQGETAEAIRRLEEFQPQHDLVIEALAGLRDRADERERQTQRGTAIARSMEGANDAFQRQDHTAAIRLADEVLLIDEGHGPARELRRRARTALNEQRRLAELERRAEQTIEDARRLFAGGEHQAAIERLTAFQPPHTAVGAALAELQAEAERLRAEAEAAAKRDADLRRADALVEHGREDLAAGRASEALTAAANALQVVPDHEGARALGDEGRALLEQARVQAERDRAAAALVETSETSFRTGQHQAALDALRGFPSPHPVVDAALARLTAAQAEIERQAREAEEQARAEARAREEAARRAREEAARKEREETDRKAEAARLAREQAEHKAKEEADRKAREAALAEETRLATLAATKAAEARAREQKEQARKEKERQEQEAERQAAALAAQQAQELAAKQAREEAERRDREMARHAKEEAARQAKEEKARLAKEATDRARAEAEQKAREEALAKRVEVTAGADPIGAGREAERTQYDPAPADGRGKATPPRTRLVAMAAGVVLVAALGYGAFRTFAPSSPATTVTSPTTTVATPPVTVAPPPAAPAPNGQQGPTTSPTPATQAPAATTAPLPVAIDAVPWANVEISPVDATSGVPAQKGTTPFVAMLPAGDYTVRFTNSLASREVVQNIKVLPGAQNSLRREMPGMDADRIVQEILPK